LLKNTATNVKTLPVPAINATAIVGVSHKASQNAAKRADGGRARVIRDCLAEQAFAVRPGLCVAMPARAHESRNPGARGEKADQGGGDDDDGKRNGKKEDRHKRRRRERLHRAAFQGTLADADDRFNDNREHCGSKTEERRPDKADLAPLGIDDAERHQRDNARHDEQAARHDPAARAMHQPTYINGELLRFGAGKQHAVVERMHEAAFRHPSFFFDQNAVHHRNLSGGSAEAQRRDTQPDAKRFSGRNAMRGQSLVSGTEKSESIDHVRPPFCWWANCAFR
jgi:hypothetical protein